MTEVSFIKLEDGRECILLDEFTYDNDKYVLLINSKKNDDYIIRKIFNDELIGLDSEEQLNKVLIYYLKNNMKNGVKYDDR